MKKLFLFALPILALGMTACGNGGGDPSSSEGDPSNPSSGSTTSIVSESSQAGGDSGTSQSQTGNAFTVNITVPGGWDISTIRDGDAVVFAYCFGGDYDPDNGTWFSTTGEGNVVNVSIEQTPEKFIIVRCAAGTTTGNWDAKWNQTDDIVYVPGQAAYEATLK